MPLCLASTEPIQNLRAPARAVAACRAELLFDQLATSVWLFAPAVLVRHVGSQLAVVFAAFGVHLRQDCAAVIELLVRSHSVLWQRQPRGIEAEPRESARKLPGEVFTLSNTVSDADHALAVGNSIIARLEADATPCTDARVVLRRRVTTAHTQPPGRTSSQACRTKRVSRLQPFSAATLEQERWRTFYGRQSAAQSECCLETLGSGWLLLSRAYSATLRGMRLAGRLGGC
eukprot:226013-Rhodomonas_salina.2